MRLAGYAALFGVADSADDTIRRGPSRARWPSERSRCRCSVSTGPQRIGSIEVAEEDAPGLRVVARVDRTDSLAASLLRRGQVSGLSFGYRARGYRRLTKGRLLEDLELFEISLVTDPLQPRARVHLVR